MDHGHYQKALLDEHRPRTSTWLLVDIDVDNVPHGHQSTCLQATAQTEDI